MDALALPAPFDATPTRVGWDISALDPHRPVAEARHRTRVWVQQHWKLPKLADSVELAVGELCTNAVRHGGGLTGLELILAACREYAPPVLRVMVIDQAPEQVPELTGDDDRSVSAAGGCTWLQRFRTGGDGTVRASTRSKFGAHSSWKKRGGCPVERCDEQLGVESGKGVN